MNVIVSADLWFPGQQDALGWPSGTHHSDRWPPAGYDPTRYVVWVDPGRGNDEQAPRQALHVQVGP